MPNRPDAKVNDALYRLAFLPAVCICVVEILMCCEMLSTASKLTAERTCEH